jgi:hypothetical protein
MKFTYDDKPDRGEPVAYIDDADNLHIKDRAGHAGDSIVIFASGSTMGGAVFKPSNPDNRRVFYRGDSITITF